MTQRVLLTGASGFVGSHFLQVLLEMTNWDIVTISSFCHNGTADRIQSVIDEHPDRCERVTHVTHDLRAPLSIRQLHVIGHVDYIFNVASRCSVDESIASPRDFIENNVNVILTMLEYARNFPVLRFFHLSTDEVYGQGDPVNVPVDHRPSSPYAASKAAQEDICQAYARTYDVPLTVVTSANMFGERQSQLAFIPRVIRALLRHDRVSIHVGLDGPGRRKYTHAGDLAAWVIASAQEYDSSVLDSPRMPLPGLFDVDNLTLAEKIAHYAQRNLQFDLVAGTLQRPGWDNDYHNLPGDPGWLQVEDHRTPENRERLFDDRLHRTVRWFLENPEWLE